MNYDEPTFIPTVQDLDKRLRKLEGEAEDRKRQADNIAWQLGKGATTTDLDNLSDRLDRIEQRLDEIEKKVG